MFAKSYNILHQYFKIDSFALTQLLRGKFKKVILIIIIILVFDDDDKDDDGDDEDDDDEDVQGRSSPNSCDPVRLKCQTPTNRPFLQRFIQLSSSSLQYCHFMLVIIK